MQYVSSSRGHLKTKDGAHSEQFSKIILWFEKVTSTDVFLVQKKNTCSLNSSSFDAWHVQRTTFRTADNSSIRSTNIRSIRRQASF